MMTFIGFIALLIFGKFLWDTYITGNTKKDWDGYTKRNPEAAARLERNSLLDFTTHSKSNQRDKEASIKVLSEYYQCNVSDVKESFIKNMIALKVTAKTAQESVKNLRQAAYIDSSKLGFDPADTPSFIKAEWVKEYLENKLYVNRWANKDDMYEDLFAINPEFTSVYDSKDDNAIREFGRKNPEFMIFVVEQSNRLNVIQNQLEETKECRELSEAETKKNKLKGQFAQFFSSGKVGDNLIKNEEDDDWL